MEKPLDLEKKQYKEIVLHALNNEICCDEEGSTLIFDVCTKAEADQIICSVIDELLNKIA